MNANLRNFALWVIIVLLLLALFTLIQNPSQRTSAQDISFSQLLSEVDQGRVRDVVIQGPEIRGTFANRATIEDVAGVVEAKQDLTECVEYLRVPGKFQRLGGRIPRGVLLVGPPGT